MIVKTIRQVIDEVCQRHGTSLEEIKRWKKGGKVPDRVINALAEITDASIITSDAMLEYHLGIESFKSAYARYHKNHNPRLWTEKA